jgi:hypothetical protein
MKLRAGAAKLAGIDKADLPLRLLADFAAQNPGLELGNYGHDANGLRAYHSEARDIRKDWQRFKTAWVEAMIEGVKAVHIIEASKSAFSGRLTWARHTVNANAHGWEYTTGQYWPTEYRKAAASVLEQAVRAVRRARRPEHRQVETIAELKALNEQNGGCWFGKGETAFFGTRIESGIIDGKYFISSEQPPYGPRQFTVRSFDDAGSIGTVGEFGAYRNLREAKEALTSLRNEVAA